MPSSIIFGVAAAADTSSGTTIGTASGVQQVEPGARRGNFFANPAYYAEISNELVQPFQAVCNGPLSDIAGIGTEEDTPAAAQAIAARLDATLTPLAPHDRDTVLWASVGRYVTIGRPDQVAQLERGLGRVKAHLAGNTNIGAIENLLPTARQAYDQFNQPKFSKSQS
ncbi:MAG TPA: hypothetical protein VHA82_21755 [Ramlibacter sp.]|uniref:hypothetical protein n=1 Tax=Ramlibacter sp. TaxID=1917967 RepID=UPI002C82703A|nr:hypothetical protein [Ramlibacter sp.]HVZ46447.1 hypothetical protein [Ramlibacter sp.]